MDVTDSSWADRMVVALGQDVCPDNIPDWARIRRYEPPTQILSTKEPPNPDTLH